MNLYNKVRGPIETSYQNVKAFLPFISSTKFVFRTLSFVLAVAFYSLYTVLKGEVRREQFRILLILLFSDDLFYLKDFLFKSIEPLINNIDLFSRR